VREIDVTRQRLKGSEASHTFHGRDVFAYVGARLAVGQLAFADVGPKLAGDVIRIPDTSTPRSPTACSVGGIPVLDVQYGDVWSNIPRELFTQLQPKLGDVFVVKVSHDGKPVFERRVPYVTSFGDVPNGQPLLDLHSLLDLSLAVNQGSFAQKYHVGSARSGRWNCGRSRRLPKIAN
jgi:S-adenosylmethionine hydrolase